MIRFRTHRLPGNATRYGIGLRITLLAVALVSITAMVVGAAVYTGVNRLLVKEEIANLGDITQLGAIRLLGYFDQLRQDVVLMASVSPVQGVLRARENGGIDPTTGIHQAQWRARLESIYIEMLRNKPAYNQLRLVDRNGNEIVSVRQVGSEFRVTLGSELEHPAGLPELADALRLPAGQVALSRFELQRIDGGASTPGQQVVRGTAAVWSAAGKILGGVVITLDFDYVSRELVHLTRHVQDVEFFITNSSGRYLYHPDPRQSFGAGGHPEQIQKAFPELVRLFLPGNREPAVSFEHLERPGGRVVHFNKVFIDPNEPGRFLGLALSASYSDVVAESLEVGRQSVALTLILVLTGASLAFIFARLLIRPIDQLTEAAEQVAAGNYCDLKLPLAASDEVGVLAGAFRGMIDQIQQRGAALEQKADELSRVNRELEQFVYVVSHDLKAPLRAVSNLSAWLDEDLGPQLSGEHREHLRLLGERVARMDAFIEALLAFSRAGRVAGEPEWTDTRGLLQEIVTLLGAAPERVRIPEDLPRFETDRVHLGQVFSNLVGNAIKHGKTDGHVWITWRDRSDGFHEFAVSDDGPGIAPENQEQIFQVFQTLRSRDETGNTGIGLAIVKKVVETLGGKITVESALGRGTTFRFTWPKQLPLATPKGSAS